ncbi:hypothetical protein HDU76_009437, partial [Blyttiomyces sp. JEL0837]
MQIRRTRKDSSSLSQNGNNVVNNEFASGNSYVNVHGHRGGESPTPGSILSMSTLNNNNNSYSNFNMNVGGVPIMTTTSSSMTTFHQGNADRDSIREVYKSSSMFGSSTTNTSSGSTLNAGNNGTTSTSSTTATTTAFFSKLRIATMFRRAKSSSDADLNVIGNDLALGQQHQQQQQPLERPPSRKGNNAVRGWS